MIQKTMQFIENVRDIYISNNINLSTYLKIPELRDEYIDINTILPPDILKEYIEHTSHLENKRNGSSKNPTLNFTSEHDFSVSNDQKKYGKNRVVEEIQHEISQRKHKQQSINVASIGIGDGQTTARYSSMLDLSGSDMLIGVDLHESYMALAKKNLYGIKTYAIDLNALSQDNHLPIDDNTIDIIECTMVGHHIENIELLFEDIARVLKPNGIFYYADLIDKTQKSSAMVFEEDHNYPPFHGVEFYRSHDSLSNMLGKHLSLKLSRRLGPGYVLLSAEKI